MLKVRCQASGTLDTKGRLQLPSALRHALQQGHIGSLVITFHQGALWGWDPATFEETVEKPLLERDPFADEVMAFTHAVLAPAQDVGIDGQGRILVPPLLRELAGLDREVIVNSVANRVEIWDRARWEERFKASIGRVGSFGGMPTGPKA